MSRRHSSMTSAFCLALVLASAAGPSLLAAGTGVEALGWLTGCWKGEGGEECWLPPLGGGMVGMNRGPEREGRAPGFEFLRIVEEEGDLVYLASPSGRYPPTPFRSIEIDAHKAVFENPEHDFPQRITYWLDVSSAQARLRARVEAKNDAGEWQGFEMSWVRANPSGE